MLKGADTDTCSTRMPGDLGRLHVLMVIPYFEWSFGGPVLVMVELAAELARRGHDVTVITTDMGL